MSRRKQSRPQHLDNDAKDMPGTDLLIAENKIRSAVTSSSPYIKVENDTEKVTTAGMTPSTAKEDTSLTHTAPSTTSKVNDENDDNASPVAKFTNDDALSKSNTERETIAMTKTTKSASCGSFTISTPMASNANSERCRRKSTDAVVKQEFSPTASIILPNSGPEDEANNELEQPQYQPSMYMPMIALERKHECETCGVSFRSKETYEVHRKHYCSGQRHKIECKLCGAKFESDKVLTMHMEVHSPRYICLICNESVASPEDCKNHMQIHVEEFERPFPGDDHIQCPKCDLSFKQNSDLLGHLCVHHVTLGNMTSFMYQQEFGRAQQARISVESVNSQRKEITTQRDIEFDSVPNVPVRDDLDDMDLRNLSPPITTSTPARRHYTTRDSSQTVDASFTCIVCSRSFSDVVSLQHHLLTSHTSVGPSKSTSPLQPTVSTKPAHRPHNRLNCRKVSTVSPPQLSRLSSATSKKISEPVLTKTITETTEPPIERVEHSKKPPIDNFDDKNFVNDKKRKERDENEALIEQIDRLQNNLKKARRDSNFVQSRVMQGFPIDKDSLDARRISCPVVSNKILEQNALPGYVAPPEEERHCIQCDIKFSSASNYRVHKKYYCASRHMKLNEDELTSLNLQEDSDIFTNKSRKRNAGNRSSMTYRKRSHLTPLETVRNSSPFAESEVMNSKKSSVRKSCPSHIDTQDKLISKTPSPNGNISPVAAPATITKKHLCQECNIWFSKYDTYVAHKKYYCESRRKDRVGVRSIHSSNKAATKRKSESCLRDAVSRSETSIYGSDRIAWSPRRNSPLTDPEDTTRKTSSISSDHNLQSDSNNPTLPFSMYAGLDQEMLARFSFMQPLIFSQYLTMIRERMALGIQNNGLLFPNLPLSNVTNGRSITPDERIRKRSADETGSGRYSGSPSKSPARQNILKYSRPTRQSCVAAINVKEEADLNIGDSSNTGASPESKINNQKRGSPLDLSNKVSQGEETKRSPEKDSPTTALYPTIDLRTTGRAIVKQEPKSDFPKTLAEDTSDKTSTSQRPLSKNKNSNNNQPETIFSEVDDHGTQSSTHDDNGSGNQQKSRAQHCKNCDAQFTNLSTFIAHKKYYCAGSSSTNNLIRSDAMAAQMAH